MKLAERRRRKATCCPKTFKDATLLSSLEKLVYIVEISDFSVRIHIFMG
jgi:hypothetical protein